MPSQHHIGLRRPRPFLQPIGTNEAGDENGSSTSNKWWIWIAMSVLGAIVLVVIATFGALLGRDDRRWTRARHDLTVVREDIGDLQRDHIVAGFMAYKNITQAIPTGPLTTLTNWTTIGGPPAYDDSGGAMNFVTGVWTTVIPGKYMVSASVCWTAGSFGVRTMVILTNGSQVATPIDSKESLVGITCTQISLLMDLTVAMTVEVQVARTSTGLEVVGSTNSFSIGRMGT